MSEPHEFDLFELQGKILHLQAEIDRLRADNRHLREAMQSINSVATTFEYDRDVRDRVKQIATDTLKRVAQ